jgi:hypothetical protein
MGLKLNGATSGYVEIDAPATAGSTSIVIPATSGNLITTGDTNTVTAAMMNTEGVALNTGYIKSKFAAVNPTNAATVGDYDLQAFSPNLSVDMGTPININTVYDISAECQLHFDSTVTGSSDPDTGGYGGLGIQVQINGGSWTTVRYTGRWATGNDANNDLNNRLAIRARYKLSGWSTGSVVFRAAWGAHRNLVFFGRIPTGNVGGTTFLQVTEYNVGETS